MPQGSPVALVTGAARGLGAAIAARLFRDGHHVILADLNAPGAAREAAKIASVGSLTAVGVHLDVCDDEGVNATIERIRTSHGRLDVLVNNAGMVTRTRSETIDTATWLRELDVNLGGTMRCSRAAFPLLRASPRGSIINLASVGSTLGLNLRLAYSASKSGIMGMTRELAAEWGRLGIRVNAVAPGYIDTVMMRAGVDAGVLSEAMLMQHTPLGRYGHPDEVAAAVAFLASSDASFVNGVMLPVDGGFIVDGTFHQEGAPSTPLE